jgi:uncharacterized protein YlaN (UPF0358 family)
MTEKEKLILAQMQVDNLLSLLKGNFYENYMCGKLFGIRYELDRQLSLLTSTSNSTKIKE